MKGAWKDWAGALLLILLYGLALFACFYGAYWWQQNQRENCREMDAYWVNDNSANGACISEDVVVRK